MNTHTITGPIELFISAWKFYRAHWKSMTTLVVLPMGTMSLGSLISQIGGMSYPAHPAISITTAIVGLLISLTGMVFMIAAVNAMIHSISTLTHEEGHVIHIWDQYKRGFVYFWPMVLISVMHSVALFGAGIFAFIPAIVLGVYTLFVSYSLVIDGKRGLSAFTDSFTLVHGRWWKVLSRLVFFIASYIAASVVVTGLTYVIRLVCRYPMDSAADGIVGGVLTLLLTLVWVPISLAYFYKLFHTLKTGRHEGAHGKYFKEWFIAFMVIGVFVFIAGCLFGNAFSSRGPDKIHTTDSNLAVTVSHTIQQ